VDLYLGVGSQPSSATQLCSSTTPHPQEYCNIQAPAAGVWWILVQNWQASDTPPDVVELVHGVVAGDAGEITAVGPTGPIPAGQPFEVTVNWQQAQLTPGDHAYGAVSLGADAAHPQNVGQINLDVVYQGAAAAQMSETAVSLIQPPDTSQTHTLTLSNAGDVDLIWSVSWETAVSQVTLDVDTAVSLPPVPPAWGDGTVFARQSLPANPSPAAPAHWARGAQWAGGSLISLILDDGGPEDAIGANGRQFIWLNRFTPAPADYPFSLTDVEVLFAAEAWSGVTVGEAVDIYVYEDADGDPNTGAEPVGSIRNALVQAADGVTFSHYTLAQPLRLTGPGDVLIAVVNRTAGVGRVAYPAAVDTSSSRARSWLGLYEAGAPADPPVIPADSSWGVLDAFQMPGNWLIRGFGEKCGAQNIPWLTVGPVQGVTPPGGSSAIELGIDTSGLAVGVYTAVLCLDSNAANLDDVFLRIPVTVAVREADYQGFLPLVVK